MGTNKYFNFFHQKGEQNLVQQLISESIRIYGIDVVYIRKTQDNIIPIYGQDPLSYYNDYYDMEMYVKNLDTFEGDSDIFTKFGLEIKNQITFSVSRSTFRQLVANEMERPREGDLIYLPMSTATALYEIRFVKDDSVFYNIGEFYIFDLQCEQVTLQDENIKTGLDEIDRLGDVASQNMILEFSSSSGEFEVGEIVYQGTSLIGANAKATVVEYDRPRNTIIIKDLFGHFKQEFGSVIGSRSGSTCSLSHDLDRQDIQNDLSAQNKIIQTDANQILDFDESNPFSEDDI